LLRGAGVAAAPPPPPPPCPPASASAARASRRVTGAVAAVFSSWRNPLLSRLLGVAHQMRRLPSSSPQLRRRTPLPFRRPTAPRRHRRLPATPLLPPPPSLGCWPPPPRRRAGASPPRFAAASRRWRRRHGLRVGWRRPTWRRRRCLEPQGTAPTRNWRLSAARKSGTPLLTIWVVVVKG